MKLAVWSPLPPSPSGIADYVVELLGELSRHLDVVVVTDRPETCGADLHRRFTIRGPADRPDADLDLYQLGNSPAHAFVYRAALERPGVAVLHDWSLHHLVLSETVERDDTPAYLREMRRAYGETGSFVGRQVSRALGGDLLPALFPLNDRLLESSLAVVGLTEQVRARAAQRIPGRPVLHLPHHLSLPLDPLPSREEARQRLGLPPDARLVTAPGLATASKRLEAVVAAVRSVRRQMPTVKLVVAGEVDPRLPLRQWIETAGLTEAAMVTGRLSLVDFVLHLVAADVVVALRFPSHGEMSGAVIRALGVGRPVVVSAGTPTAEEFPEGVVAPVDPGPYEQRDLIAVLGRLLEDDDLRDSLGHVGREHVRAHHDLPTTARSLAAFLQTVNAGKGATLAAIAADRAGDESLLSYLKEEIRWGARDLGLAGVHLGLDELLEELARKPS